MIIAYGNYRHANGLASATRTKQLVDNGNGEYSTMKEQWQITGRLQADTQAALTTAIQAMEAAYGLPNQDLIWYLDDGLTRTAHSILARNVDSIYATNITYPNSTPGNYSTYVDFVITVEASSSLAAAAGGGGGGGGGLTMFSETVDFWGGGPKYIHLRPLTGQPQKQLVNQQTLYMAIQQGQAIGINSYPLQLAAGPLFPQALVDPDQVRISYGSPTRTGFGGTKDFTAFPISWTYYFESATPLNGRPRVWK